MATRKSRTISLVPDKVKKPSGLKKDGTPNASWRKFKERLDAYTSVPVKNWTADQALGHLFKRYTDHFDMISPFLILVLHPSAQRSIALSA